MVALDLPGSGYSDLVGRVPTIEGLSTFLGALLDELEIERAASSPIRPGDSRCWTLPFTPPRLLRSLLGLALSLLLTVPALRLRIREEEAMLLTKFGNQYREYMACTWRLVPLVY